MNISLILHWILVMKFIDLKTKHRQIFSCFFCVFFIYIILRFLVRIICLHFLKVQNFNLKGRLNLLQSMFV